MVIMFFELINQAKHLWNTFV